MNLAHFQQKTYTVPLSKNTILAVTWAVTLRALRSPASHRWALAFVVGSISTDIPVYPFHWVWRVIPCAGSHVSYMQPVGSHSGLSLVCSFLVCSFQYCSRDEFFCPALELNILSGLKVTIIIKIEFKHPAFPGIVCFCELACTEHQV